MFDMIKEEGSSAAASNDAGDNVCHESMTCLCILSMNTINILND